MYQKSIITFVISFLFFQSIGQNYEKLTTKELLAIRVLTAIETKDSILFLNCHPTENQMKEMWKPDFSNIDSITFNLAVKQSFEKTMIKEVNHNYKTIIENLTWDRFKCVRPIILKITSEKSSDEFNLKKENLKVTFESMNIIYSIDLIGVSFLEDEWKVLDIIGVIKIQK